MQRLRCGVQQSVPYARWARAPDAGAVGAAMRERRDHALDVGGRGRRAVEAEQCRDAAHGPSPAVVGKGV